MTRFSISVTATLLLLSARPASAHDAGVAQILVPSDGTYEFTVDQRTSLQCFDRKGPDAGPRATCEVLLKGAPGNDLSCAQQVTTWIGLVETPINIGKAPNAPAPLYTDVIFEVNAGGAKLPPELSRVVPRSAMDAIAGAAGGVGTPVTRMKNGTVKFFNDRREIFVHATGLQDRSEELYLALPEEVQALVNEAIVRGDHVLIVFRIQEGKKGLNAVNVKLA